MSTAKNVINNFLDKGFTLLGKGCYAAVFDSKYDPNTVYKIGVNVDDPFLEYVKLRFDMGNNPHFPKIHDTYIDYKNNWYMVTMERLEPIPGHKFGLSKEITNILYENNDTLRLIKPTQDLLNITKAIRSLSETLDEVRVDLHEGNVMMRGITPVITDPLCGESIESYWDLESWFAQKEKNQQDEYC